MPHKQTSMEEIQSWKYVTENKKKKFIDILNRALNNQKKELVEEIEKYFRGLIVIPNPQATKNNLLYLIQNHETK